jgi:phosphodiesterase/alkaline phosphatase D-like protein
MNSLRAVRAMVLGAALAVAAGAGCERGYFEEPAESTAPVALSFTFGSALGGPADAFDRADRIWIRVRAGAATRFEEVFPIDANGADLRVPFEVRLGGARENASIDVELRLGNAPVFRGTSPLVLRVGRTTSANVTLDAVPAGLALPDIPALESYGDSVGRRGAIVFATGDTIDVANVTWTSLDPGVIEIRDGVPVAKTDGDARLVARLGEFSDTVQVRVFAVVRTITFDPPLTSLGLGESRRFAAKLFDARGNPILTPRSIAWLSSDTLVIRIGQDGTATGVGVGSARISAQSGNAANDVTLQARPGAPHATTELPTQIITSTALLHGTVHSGGAATQIWFEWAMEPTLTTPYTTPKQDIGAGTTTLDVQAQLTGLLPNSTYFYRMVAQNASGTSFGETLTFSTKVGTPVVQTGSATNVTQSSATLNGSAISNGAGTVWFEYGTSASLATFTKTATQILGSGNVKIAVAGGIAGLQPSTTYWFRIVAQTSAGTMQGQIFSFTTQAPPPGAPAAQTDSSSAVGQTSASLFGRVTANGAATQAWFEYGTDPLLTGAASTAPQAVGNGNAPVAVAANIAGLTPGTTYYFRMVASSSVSTVPGAILSFTTAVPPPVAPTVTTNAATAVTSGGATLGATVNANGFATQVSFQYGTDPTLAVATTTAAQSIGAGTSAIAHSEAVTGLAAATQYWFRAVATNAGGTVNGAILSFTTPAAPLAPLAFTDSAAEIGPDSAFVYGRVDPRGSATLAWFEWSEDPNFGTFSGTAARNVGAGSGEVAISDSIPDLDENTTYYVRTAASNAGGVVHGGVISFTTFMSGPVEHAAVTLPATAVSPGAGTINGTATANQSGFPTEWWFEYSLDPTMANASTTPRVMMGADLTPQSVSVPLTGLVVEARYYYRLVVSSVGGRVYGAILNFRAL